MLSNLDEVFSELCKVKNQFGAVIEIGNYYNFGLFHVVYDLNDRIKKHFTSFLSNNVDKFIESKFAFLFFENGADYIIFRDIFYKFMCENKDLIIHLTGFSSNGGLVDELTTVTMREKDNSVMDYHDVE